MRLFQLKHMNIFMVIDTNNPFSQKIPIKTNEYIHILNLLAMDFFNVC